VSEEVVDVSGAGTHLKPLHTRNVILNP